MRLSTLGCALICLAACQSGGTSQKRIGVSLLTKEHEFYRQLQSGLETEAQKYGYALLVTSGDFDLAKQQSEIDNFIVQRVDAIIVCPVDSRGIGPAIERAKAAGIPVFTADIRAYGVAVVAHVGSNSLEGGRLAAQYLTGAIHDSGSVGVIGQPEVQTGLDRENGFTTELARHPRVLLVASLSGGGVRDRALKAAEDMLQAHPDLAGIFAINDESALGALAAARARGRTAGNFTIVGFDATPEAMTAINGATPLKADIAQQPSVMGVEAIDAVAHYFAKQPVDSVITVPVKLVEATAK
jgi:ribose transport system substrate-binding protein